MQIICDTHLHSNNSHDSKASLRDICELALTKGLKIVATSEHVFWDSRDVGYGYFNLESYLEDVRNCRDIYKGKLKVLSGIEVSEPNLYPEKFTNLCRSSVDSMVGSLHWLAYGFFGDPKVLAKIDHQRLVEDYEKAVLKVVEYGGFDSFAHLDLIKRYVKVDESQVSPGMVAILKSMVGQDIALEMNTSTIRRDMQEPAASHALVEMYLALGGKRLTVGSDAHRIEDVGADFDQIPKKFYPYIGYFEKRIFTKMRQ